MTGCGLYRYRYQNQYNVGTSRSSVPTQWQKIPRYIHQHITTIRKRATLKAIKLLLLRLLWLWKLYLINVNAEVQDERPIPCISIVRKSLIGW